MAPIRRNTATTGGCEPVMRRAARLSHAKTMAAM
jgi:hypothetical protein